MKDLPVIILCVAFVFIVFTAIAEHQKSVLARVDVPVIKYQQVCDILPPPATWM